MPDTSPALRLLLSPREAAAALAVSEKTLWSMTAPRGSIPCIRAGVAGRRVLYSVDSLRRWIADREADSSADSGTVTIPAAG